MITEQHFHKVLNSNDPAVDPYNLISDAVNKHHTARDSEIVSEHFEDRTGSFLCVGAMDGKDQTL